jgi:hypothetical protein
MQLRMTNRMALCIYCAVIILNQGKSHVQTAKSVRRPAKKKSKNFYSHHKSIIGVAAGSVSNQGV